jgi:large subunit ribosomal protein L4
VAAERPLDQPAKKITRIIETFDCPDGKVKPTLSLLKKIDSGRSTLLVVSVKDKLVERATRNVSNLKVVQAKYLQVFDLLNADSVVIDKKALDMVTEWLGDSNE